MATAGTDATFTVESMVRGYHVYKDVWSASIDEHLPCRRETTNPADRFAVAVVKRDTVVGHVPKKISNVCSVFIRKGGSILCRTSGSRRFSSDLPQGGLEIPCVLIFKGNVKDTAKAKRLIEDTLKLKSCALNIPDSNAGSEVDDSVWTKFDGIVLTRRDKDKISKGEMLDDLVINSVQILLKKQFPNLLGLQSTLLQSSDQGGMKENHSQVQVIHSRGNHWIVASTIHAECGVVQVYDSIYSTVDDETRSSIKNLFIPLSSIQLIEVQKQVGGKDCGLFSCAISTALACGLEPETLSFNQAAMHPHLIHCLEQKEMSVFP